MATGRLCRLVLVVGLVLAVGVTVRPAPVAQAASLSFTVTSTADSHDATPGDGVCADSTAQCTLRAAIEEANAQPSGSTISITVPAGDYGLTLGQLALTANTVAIVGAGRSVTRIGGLHRSRVLNVGAGVTAWLRGVTITGGYAFANNGGSGILNAGRLVVAASAVVNNTTSHGGGGLSNSGTVTLSNSTVVSNSALYGGGLSNSGTVTLSNSTVARNTVFDNGGGLANSFGTVTLSNSTVARNTAGSAGGGLDNLVGTVTLSNSTVVSNTSTGGGGGLNTLYGTVTLNDSTVVSNTASVGGGLSTLFGTVTVATSTFSGNTASTSGGGIYNSSGTVMLSNSTLSGNAAPTGGGLYTNFGVVTTLSYVTVAANSSGIVADTNPIMTGTLLANSTAGPNCSGPLTEVQGYNLSSDTSCGFTQPTDITSTNPLLGPLQNNGGPAPTMALLPGSPAIDHGGTSATGCPATDQRGISRPQGVACDIGAYEAVP